MKIEYVARHFELEEKIRSYTEDKLSKVSKFVEGPVNVRVTLVQEKHRHTAEIKLSHRHGIIQSTVETDEMTSAVNLAVDKLEKQARRARKKFMDKRRRLNRRIEEPHWPVEVLEGASLTSGDGRRVIKKTTLPIKPMTVEEAVLQLEDSSNDFVVFTDSTSDQVSVLYKRRDSNYGLISPGV